MPRTPDHRAKIDLLRAAEQVFVERGLAGAHDAEITQRARCSKGAFYMHFRSKESAFELIADALLARLTTFVSTTPAPSECESPHDLLKNWRANDVHFLEFLWQNRGVMRRLLSGGGHRDIACLLDLLVDHGRTPLVGWIHAGISAGLFRESIDIDLTTWLFVGAYDRLVRTIVHGKTKPNIHFLVNSAHGLFVAGIGTNVAPIVGDKSVRATVARSVRRKIGHVSARSTAFGGKSVPIRTERGSSGA